MTPPSTLQVLDGSELLLMQKVQPDRSLPLNKSMRCPGVSAESRSARETRVENNRPPEMMAIRAVFEKFMFGGSKASSRPSSTIQKIVVIKWRPTLFVLIESSDRDWTIQCR